MIATDLRTLAVPVGNLKPLPDNPRKGDVNAVANSYKQFGQLKPIVARKLKPMKDGSPTGVVIAGNHQLLAAVQLGWTHIAVVWADVDAKTGKAFALADNRTHDLGKYDKKLLVTLLQELQSESDADLLLATGYNDKDLKILLAATGGNIPVDGLTDPDAVPDMPDKAKSVVGSVWLCGPHRVVCGDSTLTEVWAQALDGKQADMCFTDPPYNVNYGAQYNPKWADNSERLIANDNLGERFYPFLLKACQNVIAYTNGAAYICMAGIELHTLQKAWFEAGGHWSTFIIWLKNVFTFGRSDYQRKYEVILYGWKEGGTHYFPKDLRNEEDVWEYDRPRRNDLHPTMKPIALVERAISNSSLLGQTVVDPFGGSGTTLIAAHRLGRVCAMIELDPKYVDVIIKRWAEFTGLTPVHQKPS